MSFFPWIDLVHSAMNLRTASLKIDCASHVGITNRTLFFRALYPLIEIEERETEKFRLECTRKPIGHFNRPF